MPLQNPEWLSDSETIADIVEILFELEKAGLIVIKATHLELHDYLNDALELYRSKQEGE